MIFGFVKIFGLMINRRDRRYLFNYDSGFVPVYTDPYLFELFFYQQAQSSLLTCFCFLKALYIFTSY